MDCSVNGGHGCLVSFLLFLGADPNAPDGDKKTLLMKASSQGHVSVVSSLLNNKADSNAMNTDEMTALMFGTFLSRADVARLRQTQMAILSLS